MPCPTIPAKHVGICRSGGFPAAEEHSVDGSRATGKSPFPWKLTHDGKLFDMSDAPFVEKLVPAETASEAARAAGMRLQAVLNKLNPIASPLVAAERKPANDKAAKPKKKKKPAK